MKIKEIKSDYYEASGKVSELVRQLDFAGIAVIWIFKIGKDEAGGVHFSKALLWPLALFVLSLAFDLLQYVYKTAFLGVLNYRSWKKFRNDEHNVTVPHVGNFPTVSFFWIKTGLACVAFGFLLRFLLKELLRG